MKHIINKFQSLVDRLEWLYERYYWQVRTIAIAGYIIAMLYSIWFLMGIFN